MRCVQWGELTSLMARKCFSKGFTSCLSEAYDLSVNRCDFGYLIIDRNRCPTEESLKTGIFGEGYGEVFIPRYS